MTDETPAQTSPPEAAPGCQTVDTPTEALPWTSGGQAPESEPVNTGDSARHSDSKSRADLPDLAAVETSLMERGGAGHDARGKFAPGNREAAKTHRWAKRWPVALALEVDRFFHASIADDGGPSEVPTRRLALHTYRATLHGLVIACGAAIKRHGLEDRHGRIRLPWVKQYESLVRTAMSIDQTLGLDRRQRDVRSLNDYLADLAEPPVQTRPAPAWDTTDTEDRETLEAPGGAARAPVAGQE